MMVVVTGNIDLVDIPPFVILGETCLPACLFFLRCTPLRNEYRSSNSEPCFRFSFFVFLVCQVKPSQVEPIQVLNYKPGEVSIFRNISRLRVQNSFACSPKVMLHVQDLGCPCRLASDSRLTVFVCECPPPPPLPLE